jgi:hypothetical protein
MRLTSARGAMITMVLVTVLAIGAASVTAALGPHMNAFVSARAGAAEVPVTLTVREVWARSDENYERFVVVVRSMAMMSLEKRRLHLDASREAGLEIGKAVRAEAQRDPDQLLYAVVDAAVRQYTTTHPE